MTRFQPYITTPPSKSFSNLKTELVKQGRKYATEALTYRDKIAELALGFIKDDSIVKVPRVSLPPLRLPYPKILTHSYSRVVMKTLLRAHERKRISVYVTEARPRGLGLDPFLTLSALAFACY